MTKIRIPAGDSEFDFDSDWINDPTMAEAEDIELKTGMRFPDFVQGLQDAGTRSLAIVVWLAMYRAGHKWHPPGESGPREATFDDVISGRIEVRLTRVYKALGELQPPAQPDPTSPARGTGRAGSPGKRAANT